MARLYLFYQGVGGFLDRGGSGRLWYQSFDGTNWYGEVEVPPVGMSGAPSPVIWNGRTHVFHQGAYENGQLWYSYLGDTNWSPDTQVPNVGMANSPVGLGNLGVNSPSAVVYPNIPTLQNQLYIFHKGGLGEGELWYSVFDGTKWHPDTQVPNKSSSSNSPSAVVWNSLLYVFYQGGTDLVPDGQLWYSVFDGTKWHPSMQVPDVAMSDSPSAVVWNGWIHVFHMWAYQHPELWYSYLGGTGGTVWQPDTRVPNVDMLSSPSAVVYNTNLYVFHKVQNQQLWYSHFDGTNWQPDTQVPNMPAGIDDASGFATGCVIF